MFLGAVDIREWFLLHVSDDCRCCDFCKAVIEASFFIDCSGLGWKSWKRRWFILTRTSLVFFKNDPVSVGSVTHYSAYYSQVSFSGIVGIGLRM